MELRLSPITDIENKELLLSAFELLAFAQGEAIFSDLDIDFSTVLDDIKADPARYSLECEIEVLNGEPTVARQLIEEFAMDSIFELVEERNRRFGRNYAFERVKKKPTVLRKKHPDKINLAALATAWLSFFHAIDSDDFLNIRDSDRKALRNRYARVFELVALLAATTIGPSVGWWTGRNWSKSAKHENFSRLCRLVGNGVVKAYDDWQVEQKQANDAGADGFLVTTLAGEVTGASICIALGATVQERRRRQKRIGKDDRDRLLEFFVNRPTIAMIGAAADPYPHDEALAQDYSRANCLYLHCDVLWSLLSLYDPNSSAKPLATKLPSIEEELILEMKKALHGVTVNIEGSRFSINDSIESYSISPAA